jgi:hypothetical protein
MVKAAFAAAMLLMLSANARADGLYCATMIALGRPSIPHPVIVRLRLEVGLHWTRATGEALEDADLNKIIIACVDNPSATIKNVVQTIVAHEIRLTLTTDGSGYLTRNRPMHHRSTAPEQHRDGAEALAFYGMQPDRLSALMRQ